MPFTQGPWSHIAEAGARATCLFTRLVNKQVGARAEAGAGLFKQLEHTT